MNKQGLRTAALRLAVLHPADRAWLLGQLPAAEASALRELLGTRQLRRWARNLSELADLPAPVERSQPSRDEPAMLPSAVKALGPGWIALWLSAHPALGDASLEGLEAWRTGRVRDEARRFGVLPPALRAAVAAWPETPATFAELL